MEKKCKCLGCGAEFIGKSHNARFCQAPACRRMCKDGKRVKTVPPAVLPKEEEKKEPGIVIIRLKGKEYIPHQLRPDRTQWVDAPLKPEDPKPTEEDLRFEYIDRESHL